MDEALELADYMPLSFKTRTEQEYIAFLWDAFESNYTHGKYQFAFLAYHMLTMSFVYFIIWQIRNNAPEDFEKGTIGFGKDVEKNLIEATSPFTFSRVPELVDDRNETAHPNGNIFYSTQASLDQKITEIMRVVDEIQTHSTSVIQRCYENFLASSYDDEEREYPDATDQIREVLVHGHYLSQKDIEICLAYDPSPLMKRPEFTRDNMRAIDALHQEFLDEYKPKDD